MKYKTKVPAIEDTIAYLEHFITLSKTMTPEQQKDLNDIFISINILLVGFKKGTKMGQYNPKWE